MSANKGGRPSGFDPSFLQIVARMPRNRMPVRINAKVLGVSERTTWRWRRINGTECYNTIHQSNALFLSLTLAKLFEKPQPRGKEGKASRYNRSDVASIPLMIRLLKQKRCRDKLIDRAREWTPHIEFVIDAPAPCGQRSAGPLFVFISRLKVT